MEWAFLIGSVLVGHALGDTLFLSALKEIGVARTLALVGTYPLFTLLFQWVLLRRPVHSGLAVGSVLVALAWSDFRSVPERMRRIPVGARADSCLAWSFPFPHPCSGGWAPCSWSPPWPT